MKQIIIENKTKIQKIEKYLKENKFMLFEQIAVAFVNEIEEFECILINKYLKLNVAKIESNFDEKYNNVRDIKHKMSIIVDTTETNVSEIYRNSFLMNADIKDFSNNNFKYDHNINHKPTQEYKHKKWKNNLQIELDLNLEDRNSLIQKLDNPGGDLKVEYLDSSRAMSIKSYDSNRSSRRRQRDELKGKLEQNSYSLRECNFDNLFKNSK